jgi:anti-sigma B factor antagonist
MDRWNVGLTAAGAYRVCLEGVLDLANWQDFLGCLEPVVSGANNRLEVNLSGVEFMDSCGLNALLIAHRHAVESGCEMVLMAPSPPVERLLELTGCVHIFDIVRVETPYRATRGADT